VSQDSIEEPVHKGAKAGQRASSCALSRLVKTA
jgi:hypothetical protein